MQDQSETKMQNKIISIEYHKQNVLSNEYTLWQFSFLFLPSSEND